MKSMKVGKRIEKEAFENKHYFTIDSEGYTDKKGMSHLTLIAVYSNVGDREFYEIYTGEMSSQKILRWISRMYKRMIEFYQVKEMEGIIFGGSYDFTMWLKDLSHQEVLAVLDGVKVGTKEKANRGLVYVMNHFYVGLAMGKFLRFREFGGKDIWISDILGVTDMNFVNSLIALGIKVPQAELDRIAREKTQRGSFTENLTPEIIEYNKRELQYLYQMIVVIHEGLQDLMWYPKHIYGVGAVASYLLAKNHIEEQDFYESIKNMEPSSQKELIFEMEKTYFGGFIFGFKAGSINQRVYHYDLHSAYPAQMVKLPALKGGSWEKVDNPTVAEVMEASSVSIVNIVAKQRGRMKGQATLPVRYRNKVFYSDYAKWTYNVEFVKILLKYPKMYDVELKTLWKFTAKTDEKPFKFIQEIADMKELTDKKAEPVRYRLEKIGMNSSYGKLIQVLGGDDDQYPAFYNIAYASAITGGTRAVLLDAIIRSGIENAVLAMTDSIFSLRPLPEDLIGSKLGQFGEEDKITSMVVIQTGLYYYIKDDGELEFKHRGVDLPLRGNTMQEIEENQDKDHRKLADYIKDWLSYKYLSEDLKLPQKKHFRKLTFGRTPKAYKSIGRWELLEDVISGELKKISLVDFLVAGGHKEFQNKEWIKELKKDKRYDLSKTYVKLGTHPLSAEFYLLNKQQYGHVAPWLSSFMDNDYVQELEGQAKEQEERIMDEDVKISQKEGL